MNRQKIVGWVLIGASVFYIAYVLKARIFAAGPVLSTREWVYFVLSFVGFRLGTINSRLAEMRERNQKLASFIPDTKQSPKK